MEKIARYLEIQLVTNRLYHYSFDRKAVRQFIARNYGYSEDRFFKIMAMDLRGKSVKPEEFSVIYELVMTDIAVAARLMQRSLQLKISFEAT